MVMIGSPDRCKTLIRISVSFQHGCFLLKSVGDKRIRYHELGKAAPGKADKMLDLH